MRRIILFLITALLTFSLGILSHSTARFLFGCAALGECSVCAKVPRAEKIEMPSSDAPSDSQIIVLTPVCGLRFIKEDYGKVKRDITKYARYAKKPSLK